MEIPRGTEIPDQPPVHPGEVLLQEFLRPMGMTQTEAAEKMGMPLNRLNEIIHGRRGISAPTALRLSDLLGTTPQFWLNLQVAIELYQAQKDYERGQGVTNRHVQPSSRID